MKVVEAIVKVTEGGAHLTVILAGIAAIWTFYKLTENNRADMTFTIVNEFGYPIEIRCPDAIKDQNYWKDWRKIGVSLNCH